jgi:collagen type III alpha
VDDRAARLAAKRGSAKTSEERQADYQHARARIFGDAGPGASPQAQSPCEGSPTGALPSGGGAGGAGAAPPATLPRAGSPLGGEASRGAAGRAVSGPDDGGGFAPGRGRPAPGAPGAPGAGGGDVPGEPGGGAGRGAGAGAGRGARLEKKAVMRGETRAYDMVDPDYDRSRFGPRGGPGGVAGYAPDWEMGGVFFPHDPHLGGVAHTPGAGVPLQGLPMGMGPPGYQGMGPPGYHHGGVPLGWAPAQMGAMGAVPPMMGALGPVGWQQHCAMGMGGAPMAMGPGDAGGFGMAPGHFLGTGGGSPPLPTVLPTHLPTVLSGPCEVNDFTNASPAGQQGMPDGGGAGGGAAGDELGIRRDAEVPERVVAGVGGAERDIPGGAKPADKFYAEQFPALG